jgi:hypothetical protein
MSNALAEPPLVACLCCGRTLKKRYFTAHQRRKDHFGKDYAKYDRTSRMIMVYYNRMALEQLRKKFVFSQHL